LEREAGSADDPERRCIRFVVIHAPPARLLAVRQIGSHGGMADDNV